MDLLSPFEIESLRCQLRKFPHIAATIVFFAKQTDPAKMKSAHLYMREMQDLLNQLEDALS